MKLNYKPNFKNRPQHLKIDNSFYFFTIRTVNGQWFLRPDAYKKILLEILLDKSKKFGFKLIAYVILANHYHLMVKIDTASAIPKFIGEVNGASARAINKADGVIQRKFWWNYYDHIIRDEADFFKHINYIHQNPVKHQQAKSLDYEFSSYRTWVKQKGKQYLDDAFSKYPIVDFMKGDEF